MNYGILRIIFKKIPKPASPKPINRKILIVYIVYIVSIYWMAFHLADNGCNGDTLPIWLRSFLVFVSDTFFSFLEKHRPYAARLDCFKMVVAFGFTLMLPLIVILAFLSPNFLAEKGDDKFHNIQRIELFVVFVVAIGAPFIFLYTNASNIHKTTPLSGLDKNLDLWTSQANRVIFTAFSISIFFAALCARLRVFLRSFNKAGEK